MILKDRVISSMISVMAGITAGIVVWFEIKDIISGIGWGVIVMILTYYYLGGTYDKNAV